jgi:hypothetical protein
VKLKWLVILAAILGVSTVFSVDRVYDVVRPPASLPVHSSDTLLTAMLVATLLLGWIPLSLTVMAVKLVLYVGRRRVGSTPGRSFPSEKWDRLLPGLRLGLGFVLPVLLWALGPEAWSVWALPGIAASEIFDRAEFYHELEIVSPRRQAALDRDRLRQAAA